MIQSRRGLTLLETLLASAILAVLAGACVPTLSAALRAMSPTDSNAQQQLRFDLSQLADAFMIEPLKFGVKDLVKEFRTKGDLALSWPADSKPDAHTAEVRIRVLETSSTAVRNHLWLSFTEADQVVVRYLGLPKETPKP